MSKIKTAHNLTKKLEAIGRKDLSKLLTAFLFGAKLTPKQIANLPEVRERLGQPNKQLKDLGHFGKLFGLSDSKKIFKVTKDTTEAYVSMIFKKSPSKYAEKVYDVFQIFPRIYGIVAEKTEKLTPTESRGWESLILITGMEGVTAKRAIRIKEELSKWIDSDYGEEFWPSLLEKYKNSDQKTKKRIINSFSDITQEILSSYVSFAKALEKRNMNFWVMDPINVGKRGQQYVITFMDLGDMGASLYVNDIPIPTIPKLVENDSNWTYKNIAKREKGKK